MNRNHKIIRFEKANFKHQEAIFLGLEEPHVKEFWDNSQAHKDDIINFINGRKYPSTYNDGLYTYFVGLMDDVPYCLIMTLKEEKEYDIATIKKDYM